MPIIQLIVVLVVIGVLMWLVNTYLPLAEPWKRILNIIVILATVVWILSFFGIFDLGGGYVGTRHRTLP